MSYFPTTQNRTDWTDTNSVAQAPYTPAINWMAQHKSLLSKYHSLTEMNTCIQDANLSLTAKLKDTKSTILLATQRVTELEHKLNTSVAK